MVRAAKFVVGCRWVVVACRGRSGPSGVSAALKRSRGIDSTIERPGGLPLDPQNLNAVCERRCREYRGTFLIANIPDTPHAPDGPDPTRQAEPPSTTLYAVLETRGGMSINIGVIDMGINPLGNPDIPSTTPCTGVDTPAPNDDPQQISQPGPIGPDTPIWGCREFTFVGGLNAPQGVVDRALGSSQPSPGSPVTSSSPISEGY